MGYIILGIITVVLSVTGFIEIAKLLIFRMFRSKSENIIMLIIPADSDCENPEYCLRSIAERVKWRDSFYPQKLICLEDNLSEEGRKIASLICREYDFLELGHSHKLYNFFETKQ